MSFHILPLSLRDTSRSDLVTLGLAALLLVC